VSRIRRYYEDGTVYSITTVTRKREEVFQERLASQFLTTCLEYHKCIFSFKIYGFVIMPDHFHCLIQPASGGSISKIMNHIKGNFSRKYNLMVKREGALWQRRFYDTAIRGEMQLINELVYMHWNPVRAGLVTQPADYEFSSYHYYHGDSYADLIENPW
jgi:putative transposase